MGGAFEAVLRRERAIVIAALAILTALAWMDLAWLADDMAMDGMDMTGFRICLRLRDVDRDDDRYDDAIGGANDSHLCARWQAG